LEALDSGCDVQVREIRALPRADLVALSACETGSGRPLGEEGIASLERAFLLAGAKAVIASLWTADDIYTIALMNLERCAAAPVLANKVLEVQRKMRQPGREAL